MARSDLTDIEVKAFARLTVADPEARPPIWSDGAKATIRYLRVSKGLYLMLDGRRAEKGQPGTASWVYRYMIDKKARVLGLGSYPEKDLASARSLTKKDAEGVQRLKDAGEEPPAILNASDAERLRRLGQDPLALKKAERAARRAEQARAFTFKAVATDYIKTHRVKWANDKHAAQWTAMLEAYAYPIIGERIVGDLEPSDVLAVLEQLVEVGPKKPPVSLWEAKPETASRLRGRIENILDYAKVKRLRDGDNPAAWRGNLKLALPARSKVRKVRNQPALPIADLPAFMDALREAGGMGARALEFAILTAARSGEVRGARWSEIDLDAKTWTIPAERMKAGNEHRVPLPQAAVDLLEALPRKSGVDRVFVAPQGGELSDMTLAAVIKRFNEAKNGRRWVDPRQADAPVVPHGFRSTFRDWVSERTNFPSELAERALAHVIPNATEASYARGDLFEKRRSLMDAWAAYCGGVAGGNVSQFPQGAVA